MRKVHFAAIVVVLLFLGLGIHLRPVHGQSKQKGDRDAVSAILEARASKRFVSGEIIVKRKPGAPARFSAEQVSPLGVEAVERPTSGGETVYRISPGIMGTLSAEAQRDRTLTAATALQAMTGA